MQACLNSMSLLCFCNTPRALTTLVIIAVELIVVLGCASVVKSYKATAYMFSQCTRDALCCKCASHLRYKQWM
jgi:hypothetical protein